MREYAVVLTPPGGGLAPEVQSAGNTPAGFEEDEPLSDKTQGTLGWQRFGFPVPKGSKKEEALKQTVTGKIAPPASANRVLDGENEPQKDALQRAEGAEPWYSAGKKRLARAFGGTEEMRVPSPACMRWRRVPPAKVVCIAETESAVRCLRKISRTTAWIQARKFCTGGNARAGSNVWAGKGSFAPHPHSSVDALRPISARTRRN